MADSSLLRNGTGANNKAYTMALAILLVKTSSRATSGAVLCCDLVYLSALSHPSYKHQVSYRHYRDAHRSTTIGKQQWFNLRALVYSLLQGMLGVCHIGVHTHHRLVEAIICRAEAFLSLHMRANNTNNVRENVGNSLQNSGYYWNRNTQFRI